MLPWTPPFAAREAGRNKRRVPTWPARPRSQGPFPYNKGNAHRRSCEGRIAPTPERCYDHHRTERLTSFSCKGRRRVYRRRPAYSICLFSLVCSTVLHIAIAPGSLPARRPSVDHYLSHTWGEFTEGLQRNRNDRSSFSQPPFRAAAQAKTPVLANQGPGVRMLSTSPGGRLTREDSARLVAGRSSGFRLSRPCKRSHPHAAPSRPDTHRNSGISQHSSPVTAARPRPILTAFPFSPGYGRDTCNKLHHSSCPPACQESF